eukprot:11830-Heterococcus_DN1.PRE.6
MHYQSKQHITLSRLNAMYSVYYDRTAGSKHITHGRSLCTVQHHQYIQKITAVNTIHLRQSFTQSAASASCVD